MSVFKLTYEEVVKLYEKTNNKNKTVYRYNLEDENVFVGEEIAPFDPIESQIAGKICLMIPADCTINKPENKNGKVALFNKDKKDWEYFDDVKGKSYYDFETESVKQIVKRKNSENYKILSEEELKEIYSGKKVRENNGKYEFYFTDEFLIEKISNQANSYLSKYDFYFNRDYPEDKVPARLEEYRMYLRGLNSEHNLKGKDLNEIKVLTFEEFILE